jgi:PAS domain S-box-containing protein
MPTPLRVLIAEDSADDADLLRLELSRGGFDPVSKRVDNAEEMQASLTEDRWEIVLSDYSMPGFGAAAALALCREFDPDLPFIVISGTIGEERAVEMMRAGASDYLLKGSLARLAPVVERELREAVNRRAHRRAQEAVARLAAIVESSDDAIISETLDGLIISWNPAAERLFGWAAAEAIGRHISFIVSPDQADEFAGVMERLLRGEPFEQLETVRVHRDGNRRDVSITASPIRDSDGRLTGISKIARDVTARKLAEAQLREARAATEHHLARLRAVFASMTEGVIVSDKVGHMLDWNAAALEVHGQTEVEMIRQPLAWFAVRYELISLHGSLVPVSEWPLARVLRGETFIGWEVQLRHLDSGRERVVSYGGAPIRGDDGEVEQAVLTIHDVTEQKHAERESLMLRSIIEFSPNFIAVTHLNNRVVFVNRAGQALLGLNPDEVGRTAVADYHSAEELDRIEREVIPILRTGGSVTGEIAFRHFRTGATIPAEWNVFAIPAPNVNGPAFFACVAQDITDRKRAERELRESEERYRQVVEGQTEVVCRFRSDGVITFVNEVFCRVFGGRVEDLLGKRWQPLPHPDDLPMIEDKLARMSPANPVALIENRVVDAAGQMRWMEFANHGFYDAEGRLTEIQSVGRDVTDRRRAQDNLRASEQRLRHQSRILQSVLDNMSDGVAVADERGTFLLFNPAAEQILGAGATASPPEHWAEHYSLYLPDGTTPYPAAEVPLTRALRGEHCDDVEMIVNHNRDPETRWISVNARPMRDEEGILRGGVAVFRNITERKRSETAIQQSEERFRTLVSATAAIVWSSPAAGEFDSEQPAWTAFTGQSVEQHREWGWLDAVHPDDREKSTNAWAAAVRTSSTYQVERRLRRADGVYRDMSVRAIPIFEKNGVVREWVGIHIDVTDQKRAEEAVHASEARFRGFMDHTPAAADIKDEDGRLLYVNAAWRRQFGQEPIDWEGKTNYDFWPRETAERFQASDQQCLARNAVIELEEVGWTPAGEEVTMMVLKFPLLDGGQRRIGGMAWDISDRKQAEKALQLTQQRLRHVLASSPAILYTLVIENDQIVRLSWVSDNVKEIFGYTPEAALAPGWWKRSIHPEDREGVLSQTQKALFGQGSAANEYRFQNQDGTYRWARSEIRLIRDTTNRAVEAVGSWTDITARKVLEEQFRQAQKMDAFGQLAGGVAHDFNNLLTIINGYSQLLLDALPAGDESRGLIAEIYKAGERSAGLTRQLLAFSRQQVLAPRVLNLNTVVTETDKMLRRLIGEDVRLTTTLASKLWAVQADPGQVEQVLLNLAVNARDAMPRGGRLTIETRNLELDDTYLRDHADARAGPHVVLSVTDTGCGMPPEVRAKVFEPFFTTKGPGKGTGLGLATVYGIVTQSGGHIAVYSEVGVGTTFKVYLPRVEQADEVPETPSKKLAPPRGTETILLAEDEAGVRALAGYVLASCGYTVLEAIDGADAVRVAAGYAGPIHLLITDVVMPGEGGRAVAEHVAQRHPGVRVLFMSGYTDDAVIRHGVLREGMNFLQKPFAPLALALKAREVLDATVETSGL